ncbi:MULTISPECIES: hypothetical protein [Sphingobacterium]|uniref:hypothetical protein n=1 Tax=Sphingobacterium TaxID=28453 RepID=UPI00257C4ED1|nr:MULTISPECIES: hypothetical protein [Sphingobacterium]
MDDIIGKSESPFDKQTFRITFKSKDYQVVLLKTDLKKNQTEISVLLDGSVQKMIKKNNKWCFDHGKDEELANDIWRAISLRYRIFT